MYWIGFYNNRDRKEVWSREVKTFREVCEILARRRLFPQLVSPEDLVKLHEADKAGAYQDNEWVDQQGIYALAIEGSPNTPSPPKAKAIHTRAEDAAHELASDIMKARTAMGNPHPELSHLDHPVVMNEILSVMRLLFDAYTTTSHQTLWVKWYVDSILKGADSFAVAYYG